MDQLLINPNYPHILSTLIFLPLAGALLLFFVQNEYFARFWALGIATLTAILSIPLVSAFDQTSAKFQFAEQFSWINSLNIQYVIGIDGISILLVMLTTLIMPLCILASWSYIKTRVQTFMICLLIMETAMLGVFMALDFVLFYILWEAMLIPMYLLIGIWGGPRKIYASIKFFLYTLAGPSCCLLELSGSTRRIITPFLSQI